MAQARIGCPGCGQGYRWEARIAGRKFKCPVCEVILRVPAEAGQPVEIVELPPSFEPEPEPDMDLGSGRQLYVESESQNSGSGYELDLSDSQAGLIDPEPIQDENEYETNDDAKAKKCPSCNAPVDTGSRICVSCGYDLETGMRLKTSVEPVSTAAVDAVRATRTEVATRRLLKQLGY